VKIREGKGRNGREGKAGQGKGTEGE